MHAPKDPKKQCGVLIFWRAGKVAEIHWMLTLNFWENVHLAYESLQTCARHRKYLCWVFVSTQQAWWTSHTRSIVDLLTFLSSGACTDFTRGFHHITSKESHFGRLACESLVLTFCMTLNQQVRYTFEQSLNRIPRLFSQNTKSFIDFEIWCAQVLLQAKY